VETTAQGGGNNKYKNKNKNKKAVGNNQPLAGTPTVVAAVVSGGRGP
jgi:hypothetical protein